MLSSTPYIIGTESINNGKTENVRTKKYKRRRVYVLNVKRIILFSIAIILLISAPAGYIIYRRYSKYILPSTTYYYLQLSQTDNGTLASSLSSDYIAKGAAGYIVNDGVFRIMANVYSDHNDAMTVQSRFVDSYENCLLYEVKIAKINLMNYMDRQPAKEVYPILYNARYEIFEALQKLDYSLDRGEISQAAVLLSVKNLREGLVKNISDINGILESYPTNKALKITLDYLLSIVSILDNNLPIENYTVGHKIKLTLCQIVNLYQSTVNLFKEI